MLRVIVRVFVLWSGKNLDVTEVEKCPALFCYVVRREMLCCQAVG